MPKLRIRVTATISEEYELTSDFFPELSNPTEEEMLKEQQKFLEEDASSLLESGVLSNIKVEKIDA